MATLNTYINTLGETVPVPNKPVTKYDPNAIARITPKASRAAAKLDYAAWVAGGMASPYDGTYIDIDGSTAVDLVYADE
jgi:hypothetical protein